MYFCSFCNREFKSKSACTQHERYDCSLNSNKLNRVIRNKYTQHKKQICRFCGKSFDVANIIRHEAACANPLSNLNLKKASVPLTHDDLFCKYCNKECKNKNALAQHEIRCRKNPDRKDYDKLGLFSHEFFLGETKDTSERVAKAANTLHERYKSGEIVPAALGNNGWLGHKHSEETKEKQRIGMINYISSTRGIISPSYNKVGCEFICNLNRQFNLNFKHAENGGEFQVAGYLLDG